MTTPVAAVTTAPPADPDTGTDLDTLLAEPLARPWYRRPATWVGVLLLAFTAVGLSYWQARQTAGAAPSDTTEKVARGNLTLTVTATRTLQRTRSINVGSELSGTVLKVNVDVNDQVKKGQVMVELDTAKLRDTILRSRAMLAVANAKVAQTVATPTPATRWPHRSRR